eukprot:scaffold4297_cov152-Skeletonema_menzelii.AAC.4
MLSADPQQRLTLSEIVDHPWMRGDMNLSQFNRLRVDTTSTIFTLEKEMMEMDDNTIGSSEDRVSPFSDILIEGEETDRSFKPKTFPAALKSKSFWRGVIKTIYASISSLVVKKSNKNDVTTFSGENQVKVTGSLC